MYKKRLRDVETDSHTGHYPIKWPVNWNWIVYKVYMEQDKSDEIGQNVRQLAHYFHTPGKIHIWLSSLIQDDVKIPVTMFLDKSQLKQDGSNPLLIRVYGKQMWIYFAAVPFLIYSCLCIFTLSFCSWYSQFSTSSLSSLMQFWNFSN